MSITGTESRPSTGRFIDRRRQPWGLLYPSCDPPRSVLAVTGWRACGAPGRRVEGCKALAGGAPNLCPGSPQRRIELAVAVRQHQDTLDVVARLVEAQGLEEVVHPDLGTRLLPQPLDAV